MMKKLEEILAYCKMIDRNGSWEEVINDIKNEQSTLLDELEILHGTLSDWLTEEFESSETYKHLKTVTNMIKEERNK